MKPGTLEISFNQGVAAPPKLGTLILKPTPSGKLSYAQNVTNSNDKYGDNVVTPGPYINAFSTSLSNTVYWKAVISQNVSSKNGQMWVAYAGGSTVDYIKGINSGSGPSYETSGTVSLSVSGHTPLISDMVSSGEPGGGIGTEYVFASLNENAGGNAWIAMFQSSGSISYGTLSSTTAAGVLPMIKTQFDGKIYIGNNVKIDVLDPSKSSLAAAITLGAIGTSGQAIPNEWNITALGEWNNLLVVAANTESPGDFSRRLGGGQSRIFFFDVAGNPTGNFKTNFVNSSSHYISVLFTDLSGNLLAFGGVDEGRTTIYEYNGYGFIPLFSYIGDMPRNRHSVCYDAQGRLMWITCNGQICRLTASQLIAVSAEEQAGGFEHIGTIGTSGTGGILANLQSTGNDFVVSGLITLANISFTGGNFTGWSGSYDTGTPLVVSGIQSLPPKSIITKVTTYLNKALQQGESLDVNFYLQGTSGLQGTNLGSLNYGNDGAIANKQIRTSQYQMDEFALGAAWTTSNGTTTVPGLLKITVDYNEITVT